MNTIERIALVGIVFLLCLSGALGFENSQQKKTVSSLKSELTVLKKKQDSVVSLPESRPVEESVYSTSKDPIESSESEADQLAEHFFKACYTYTTTKERNTALEPYTTSAFLEHFTSQVVSDDPSVPVVSELESYDVYQVKADDGLSSIIARVQVSYKVADNEKTIYTTLVTLKVTSDETGSLINDMIIESIQNQTQSKVW